MADLVLPLKAEYFDAIRDGQKLEEFRERTPYWRRRLEGRTFDRVVLTLGYRTPNSQSLQERGQGSKGEQLPNFVEHHFSHPVLSTLDGRQLSPTDRTLPRRLNPAFACWLMGWPIWWTNPALTSCAKLAMASYRCRLQWHLSSLCGVPLVEKAGEK